MQDTSGSPPEGGRRSFLTTTLMILGIVAGYGLGLSHFFKFLVPPGKRRTREMFAGTLDSLPVGSTVAITGTKGAKINLVRLAEATEDPAAGFKALSSTCPHLGCKVHWEAGRECFFCPCHNGVFDPQGVAVSGPPAAEGKDLPTYPVHVDARNGWVFVVVPEEDRHA